MCWKTYIDENAEIRTAERDIPVFKVAYIDESGEECRPYYARSSEKMKFFRERSSRSKMRFFRERSSRPTNRYEKGVTYRPNGFGALRHTEGGYYAASEGFHSYSPECKAEVRAEASGTACGRVVVYSAKRDCLNDMLGWHEHERLCVMRCSIPKGAAYRLNEYGEYVSDAIRVESFEPLL